MPDLTKNIGLKKPLDNETVDIGIINENMDVIDSLAGPGRTAETVKKNADNIENLLAKMAEFASTELNKGASKIAIHDADSNFSASNVEEALNELFQYVSNGKSNLYSAIADMGQTPTNTEFANLVSAIRAISTDAIATSNDIFKGKTAYVGGIKVTGTASKLIFGNEPPTSDVGLDGDYYSQSYKVLWYKEAGGWEKFIHEIQSGTIIMFHGLEREVPNDWVFCDGTNGTPDLRDRFIMGGDSYGETGNGYHTHTLSASGSHNHSLDTSTHTHDIGDKSSVSRFYGGYTHISADYGGSHSHSSNSNTHNHNGTASAIVEPKYYKLAFIMKI